MILTKIGPRPKVAKPGTCRHLIRRGDGITRRCGREVRIHDGRERCNAHRNIEHPK